MGKRSDHPSLADPPCAGAGPVDGPILSVEAANALVQAIFAVGLELAGWARTAGPPVAERLQGAIDDLDAVVNGLQRAVVDHIGAGAEPRSSGAGGEGIGATLDLLEQAAGVATGLIAGAADAREMVQLLDAQHDINRAIITLRNTAGVLAT